MNNLQHDNKVTLLHTKIVGGGYCVGCGTCAALPGSPLNMLLDRYGRFVPSMSASVYGDIPDIPVLEVCPFSGEGPDENDIGKELYGSNCKYNERIGYYLDTYAGFVAEDNYRDRGSSGGMTTWMLCELFKHGLIDGAIHVRENTVAKSIKPLFSYQVSYSIDQIQQGAKSRYYPVEMSTVLNTIREKPGRYAIVGVPCFIKAVRRLSKFDPIVQQRIRFYLGLVCGHMKSSRFAEMFGWQCDIRPSDIFSIDFRKKIPRQDANKYGIEIVGLRGNREVRIARPNYQFYGHLWSHGFFKYQACDYCDDVIAETADVTFGDAWIPQYLQDSSGTNIVITRNSIIQDLIQGAESAGRLHLDKIGVEEVVKSQAAGFRHRREGLAYRLFLKDNTGQWRPPKRVQADFRHLSSKQRRIYRLREEIAAESHLAFEEALKQDDFSAFTSHMDPLLKKYENISKPTFLKPFFPLARRLIKQHHKADSQQWETSDRRMRIAFIVGEFPALSETFILNQITGLIDRGHEVDIFAKRKRRESKIHPDVNRYALLSRTYYRNAPKKGALRIIKGIGLIAVNIPRCPIVILKSLNIGRYGMTSLSLELLYAALQCLGKEPYDIIHCHFGPNGSLGVSLRDIGVIKGKVVTSFHGVDMSMRISKEGNEIYRFLFEKGDIFLPISERWKEKLVKMGCDERRIIVHRMGVDTDKFRFSSRDNQKGAVQLLTVGRLIEKKGVEYGIRAVAEVLKNYQDIEYKIAGDGPLKKKLASLIEELGASGQIKLLGWQQQTEIAELMQKADIFIAPSVTSTEGDQEGIPVTLMESLAGGLPVISTEHSGIPELVRDGESGFLVPERDVDALIERLEYLIDNPTVRRRMGYAGRKFVEDYYDIDKLNDRLVEIYQELLVSEIT